MIVVPAGVPRSLKNNGDKDALFCVVIGAQKPQVPTYPETSADARHHAATDPMRPDVQPVSSPARDVASDWPWPAGLGADGARVWLADVRTDGRGEAAAGQLRADGHEAHFVARRRHRRGRSRMAAASPPLGPLYGLVNNAALRRRRGRQAVHDIAVDEWDPLMAVNLRGPWLVARPSLPLMIAARPRPDRQHRLGRRAVRLAAARALHRLQGRGGRADPGHGPRPRPARHHRQHRLPRPHRDRGGAELPEHRHQLYRDNRALDRAQQPPTSSGAVAFLLGPRAGYLTGQHSSSTAASSLH